MKLGENLSALSAMGNVNEQAKTSCFAPELKPPSEQIADGAKLIAKTLEVMAKQGWRDVKKLKKMPEPTLSPEVLAQKTKLEEKGLIVTVRPDGKFIVEAPKDKVSWLSSEDIRNAAVLKGDFEIYNGAPQSDVEYPNLELVEGNLTINGFEDECRTSGPNWGCTCDVIFSNLKEVTGDFSIYNSACKLYLNSLKEVGGTLNIGATAQMDNIVSLNNIESIGGNLNIQGGSVQTSSQIFSAVEGTMNAIPPKSDGTTLQVGEGEKAKYYEFTTEPEVIKKLTK